MEKVRLPKEVAEAIVSFRDVYKPDAEYDLELIHNEGWPYTNTISEYVRESRENMKRYFHALVHGYEVEETPEDKVRAKYKQWESERGAYKPNHYRIEGMMFALETFGHKVEGVND